MNAVINGGKIVAETSNQQTMDFLVQYNEPIESAAGIMTFPNL